MTKSKTSKYPTRHGYMTEKIQSDYIKAAVAKNLLPVDAHRLPQIVSLTASSDRSKPLQFWQLYSVLGQDRIVDIVGNFYERVFKDEDWFTSVFARVGGIGHHVNTQAAMWIDVMGGGPYYHGAEFRLNFHHTHNAVQLMNEKGAARWSKLMIDTLDASGQHMTDDPRVRPSINTFMTHFMGKYSQEFAFENRSVFGPTNLPVKRKINFLKMTTEAIEALSETELSDALKERGVDVSKYADKKDLVNKALMM
ncbi:MAG: truncated hemoglobin YjbI [Paracoccaceae bacterium]